MSLRVSLLVLSAMCALCLGTIPGKYRNWNNCMCCMTSSVSSKRVGLARDSLYGTEKCTGLGWK